MIEIDDFTTDGWRPAEAAEARAKACCEQLERGGILLLRDLSLILSGADQELLTRVPPNAVAHKNIAYEPTRGALRGLRRGVEAEALEYKAIQRPEPVHLPALR